LEGSKGLPFKTEGSKTFGQKKTVSAFLPRTIPAAFYPNQRT